MGKDTLQIMAKSKQQSPKLRMLVLVILSLNGTSNLLNLW